MFRRGLSLVEVMISLAISASLLTAIAAAFSASASAIEVNDEIFRATQASRVTMLHLLTEIRQGEVSPNSTAAAMRLISGSGSVSGAGADRTYRFTGAPANQLLLVTESDLTDLDYPLARNVLATDAVNDSKFEYTFKDLPTGRVVLQVTVTLVTKVNKNTIRLSGTASPRTYMDR
jgi:prepilin-type N-terminal cleavage/methylation domain-containing protein